MYQQQHRPDVIIILDIVFSLKSKYVYLLSYDNAFALDFMQDNNIEFWRKFVSEYFAPNAKKKWCVSMYGNGRQTTGVFPQVCCKRKPYKLFLMPG